MKLLLNILCLFFLTSNLIAADKKTGRAFGDQYGFEDLWPAKYDHKKFKKIKKGIYWCTYKLAEFAKEDWFRDWKK